MRPIAIIFSFICLVLGTGFGWLIATKTIDWVETAQVAELEQSMFAGGINWLSYAPDGFTVTISGEAPDPEQQSRAIQIATMIVDEGLIDQTTVAAPVVVPVESTQPMVEIMRNGTDISLIGRLPVGVGRALLDAGIDALHGPVAVVDISEPFLGELPAGWSSAIGFGAQILSQTEQAIVTVTPGQVVVEAVAGTANWQDGFLELLENMRPSDVSLLINIATPRPVISPYRFVLDLSGETKAACSAQNRVEAKRIQEVSAALNLPVAGCQIGIGAPSIDWGQVVEQSLETHAALGGSLAIEDSDITLLAPIGTDPVEMEAAILVLQSALPEVYSLHAVILEAAPSAAELAAVIPATFSADLAVDGIVTLNGTLKDELTRDVVIRYAESKFGYNLVEAQFIYLAELPDGWQKRVFAAVEALSLLESGGLEMSSTGLSISGVASFESPEDEVSKILRATLGESASFDLALSYEPGAATEEDMLDPRICAARVTTILGDNQISFAPSSAVIEESSKPTIEAITNILTNCRNAEFEIGGHTDSQGREEMNRALSQSRADAVLDAMLAQNLLLGTITALGYGEVEPIADNETEEGRAANRRIVIKMQRDSDHETEEETSDEQN